MGVFNEDDPWVSNLTSEANRREFARKAAANIGDSTSNTVAIKPPKVSGLTLTAVVDGIQLDWNDVGIRDLAYYEVQTSTSQAFVNPTSVRVRQEQYIFRNLDPSTTYYIRVRAKNLSENFGDYSSALNSTTGLIVATELTVGATQTLHSVSQSGSPIFSLTTQDGGTETASNNSSDLTFTVLDTDTIIIPRSIIQLDYDSTWDSSSTANNLVINLREDTGSGFSTVDTAQIDFKSSVPTAGSSKARLTVPTFTEFRTGLSGSVTYDLEFTNTSNGSGSSTALDIDFLEISLQFIQIKR